MDQQMLPVKPFTAQADFAHESQPEDIREVQVVGLADDAGRLRWVAIETVNGWEYPHLVDAVKWPGPKEGGWRE